MPKLTYEEILKEGGKFPFKTDLITILDLMNLSCCYTDFSCIALIFVNVLAITFVREYESFRVRTKYNLLL